MSLLDVATTDRRSAEADAFKTNENILGGRMTHSISTPSGVDGAISTLGHRGGKKLTVRIQMLDDSVTMFQVQAKALGKVLFEQVCRQLNLLEADYFGLEYQEMSTHTKYWLDLEKPLNRQVGFSLMDPMLRFCVKFYTPDPAQLEEEYTRYLFCLQIKRDLASGSLQCNDNTAALMASYIVQASCGDFVPEDYPDHTYLSSYRFVPHQDDIMQRKIMENHKKHVGQSPAEADMNLLETARRCELYGMKMHAAKDIEGVPLNLAVAHMGITVFQNITRINTFSWAKIRKISFKRKRFLIKLHPEGYGYYKDTVEFYFEGRNECKNFWKKCVENHGFFRCITVQKQPRRKSRVLSRGSSFRYSGKTQKQMIEFVRENYVKRQNFQRSQSFRQGTFSSSSRCQSKTYVNSSISANPLLPVNTADWDCQNLNSDLTTTSTRREMASLDHQQNILTDSTSTQVTAAQVEILPTKNSSAEMQNKEAAKMNHSVLVQNPQLRNSLNNNNNNKTNMSANALEQDHMRQNVHNFDSDDDETKHTLSLHRHSKGVDIQSLYDLTLGSDKSSNLSCSETGTYDVIQAESLQRKIKNANMEERSKGTEVKKRKWENETSYFLIKELLMTERTYKRDLEILNDSFRQFLTAQDIESLHPLFDMLETMTQHHNTFLREIEHRLLAYESKGISETRVGDIMLKHLSALPIYDEYVQSILDILQCMNDMCNMDTRFENVFKDFEQQTICYLPVAELMLKPLYRVLHYELIFQRLCDFYPRNNIDFIDCQAVYNVLVRTTKQIRDNLLESVNFVQMFELQRNVTGLNKLIQKPRCFVRHGYLLKHSKRGLQQRMFILLSDFLLYGLKLPAEDKFHILGHVPVRSLLTENAEHNMFLIYGGKSALTVSAATTAEKTLWLAELSKAAENIRNQVPTPLPLNLFKNRGSSEESIDTSSYTVVNDSTMPSMKLQQLTQKLGQSRSNTALHVCWHRGATIGIGDYMRSAENQLSGYLLRKFKNSSGWQKLWVVFASFCLYFYKSFQDETALASLPILGYTVGPPAHQDAVQKDFVFKLTFKNHIYFFRAESQQTYTRWLEVLKSTTQTQDFKNMYCN